MAKKTPKVRKAAGGRLLLELDVDGVREFLQHDPEVQRAVIRHGERVAQAMAAAASSAGHVGAAFRARAFIGSDRVRVHVGTDNIEAMVAEAQDRIMLRALGNLGGGGQS